MCRLHAHDILLVGTALVVSWHNALIKGQQSGIIMMLRDCNFSSLCYLLLSPVDRSFAVAGPRAWNKLSPPLRHVDSAETFKRQLKTFLFDNAFNSHC